MPETDTEKMKFLWQTVNEFAIQFKTSISGTYSRENAKRNEMPAGSKIREILKELYDDKEGRNLCDIYQNEDIKRAIQAHEGDSIPGFPSIDAFLALLIPQLKKLKDPAQDTISEVYSVLEDLAIRILERVCKKLPAMKQEL